MNKKYVLLLILFGLHVGAMDIVQQPTKEVNKKENVGEYEPLVEDISHKIILKTKSVDGVVSDKHILFDKNILSSVESLQMLWERRQDKNEYAIFVADEFELDTYGFVLHILDLFMSRKSDKIIKINQELNELGGLDELIEVINCAYFLQVNNDKVLKFFGTKVSDWIRKQISLEDYKTLLSLNADFAEKYVLPQIMAYVISYLKATIIKKYGTTDIFSIDMYLIDRHQVYFFNNNESVQSSLVLITDGSEECSIDDVITGQVVHSLRAIAWTTMYAICGNNLIGAGCWDRGGTNLIVWNLDKKDQGNVKSYAFTDGTIRIQDISFSPSGKYLVSVGENYAQGEFTGNIITVWNTDNIPWDTDLSHYQIPHSTFKHGLDRVIKVDAASDNEFLVLGFQDKNIKLMKVIMKGNADNLQFESEEIVSHEWIIPKWFDSYERIVFSFDHKRAALLLYGGAYNNPDDAYKIIFFDVTNGTSIEKQLSIKKDGKISSIAFGSDNTWLACSKRGSKEISVYDAASGEALPSIAGLYYGNSLVRFSADGSKMMLLGNDSIVSASTPFGDCKVKELLTNKQLKAFNRLKEMKDFDQVLIMYAICQQLKESNSSLTSSVVGDTFVLSEDDDLFKQLTDENKNLLQNIGLTQQPPKKTWRQWFSQRSWKEIFGGAAAAVGITGYGAYKYMSQPKE